MSEQIANGKSQITNGKLQTESTVSANVKLIGQNGADIMLTVRSGATLEEVTGVLDVMAQGLVVAKEKYHLSPMPARGSNGHGGNGNGGVPVCPVHKKPMKKSQYNGWYCPHKLEDGSYCKETSKNN